MIEHHRRNKFGLATAGAKNESWQPERWVVSHRPPGVSRKRLLVPLNEEELDNILNNLAIYLKLGCLF